MSDFKEAESLSIFDLRDRIVAQDKVIADMAEKVRLLTITVAATSHPVYVADPSKSPVEPKSLAESYARNAALLGPDGLKVEFSRDPTGPTLEAPHVSCVRDVYGNPMDGQNCMGVWRTAGDIDEILQRSSAISVRWVNKCGLSAQRMANAGFKCNLSASVWEKVATA